MPKSTSSSFLLRAILALVLMIGFYGLAIAFAGLLLYIPWAEWSFAHRVHPKLAFFCIIGAGIILWSILPRIDRFSPPGPLLEPSKHPRLFKELNRIAKSVGQPMPADVYLIPDVNAWVSHRGGIMGFGSRLVMGLGLPLLQILTISQLRAVFAHEFGHFVGKDVKLGPWVYKTRTAIGRTLEGLAKHNSTLLLPFLWYGKKFLKITHAVSRHQEYAADQLAARIVGSRPLISGLNAIHCAAFAFGPFWMDEVLPIIKAGFIPSLSDGFARFIHAPSINEAISRAREEEVEDLNNNPYDTHPPLRERIAAVQELTSATEVANDLLGITLIEDLPELERQIIDILLMGEHRIDKLKHVDWEEIGLQVYVPKWETLVQQQAEALAGVTPRSLPEISQALTAFGNRLKKPYGVVLSNEEIHMLVFTTVGAALAKALIKKGWRLLTPPGEGISLRRNGESVEPFGVLPSLLSGELGADAWRHRCESIGITEMDLGGVTTGGVKVENPSP